MLTDKIHPHPKQEYDIIDDLRGEKILWPKGTSLQSLAHEIREIAQQSGKAVTIVDMAKLLLQYSRDGDLNKVHELIARGAPFTTDWLGMSALHFAAMNNRYEVCEMLLRGGINKDGKTKVDRTPLHFAVYEGHEEIVKLLLSKNCDVNPMDMLRMTPLHWAVERGHKNIVRILLKHGACVSIASKFNKTPISIAIQTKQTDLLPELEEEKERQEKAALKIEPDENQNETETSQAVKSIAGTSNYDNIMANLGEEFDSVDTEKDNMGHVPTSEECTTNKTDTCPSSDDLIDEDMDYVEPIIQLESIDDEPRQLDSSALELLKCHGISMLPADDPENTLITSALQSGRKLILSEAGKRILNDTKMKSENGSPSNVNEHNETNTEIKKSPVSKKAPILLRAKGMPLKPNKNIKIITMDIFKKMYGTEMANSIRKAQASIKSQNGNVTPTITKITKIQNVSNGGKASATKPQPTARIISLQKVSRKTEDDDDLPPNIEVCSDSDVEEIIPKANTPKSMTNTNSNVTKATHNTTSDQSMQISTNCSTNASANASSKPPLEKCVKLPVLSLPEVTRQLFLIRKQLEDLRKQFQVVQKENAEYKERIEQLEKDRDNYNRSLQ